MVVPGHVLALRVAVAATKPPPAPPVPGVAAQVATKAAGLFCLAFLLTGCQQAVSAIGPGIAFAGCVWNTYQGIPAGTPLVQVIAQEIQACGGDGVSVVTVLDQREAPAMHKTMAHESATAPAVSK